MTTRMQKLRLGVFMLLAMLILVGSVVTLAGLKLWNPRDRYFVRFQESISGLEVGSTVKMKGVRVGQVEQITIGRDVESVIVTLSLTPKTPITEDTRAVMTSIGITGLKFIELTGGTTRSKRVQPNTQKSIIRAGPSTLQTLTGKATDIALKMEALLNNLLNITAEGNQVRIARLLEDTDRLMVSWEEVARENKGRLKRILVNVDRTTALLERASGTVAKLAQDNSAHVRDALVSAAGAARSLSKAVQNLKPQETLKAINSAANSVQKRVNDPSITQALNSLGSSANRMKGLVDQLSKVVDHRDRQIGTIMRNLDRASEYLKEFARSIKDRPSLLLRGETRKERTVP
jgi:phospholipid/cholesterol/gamma-HCH transport system substrate-binding protein